MGPQDLLLSNENSGNYRFFFVNLVISKLFLDIKNIGKYYCLDECLSKGSPISLLLTNMYIHEILRGNIV